MDWKLLAFCLVGLIFLTHGASGRATDHGKSSFILSDNDQEINAVWADFQKRHILNPNVPAESSYLSWGRVSWNNFLKTRITDYGSKSVNSFMVGVTSTILSDFKSGYSQNYRHNGSGISGNPQNLYWGVSKFRNYILRLTSAKDYDVYSCGTQYILAAIDSKIEPVHFQTQRSTRVTSGALPLDMTGCTLDSLCKPNKKIQFFT